jgi:hypothetical protein
MLFAEIRFLLYFGFTAVQAREFQHLFAAASVQSWMGEVTLSILKMKQPELGF